MILRQITKWVSVPVLQRKISARADFLQTFLVSQEIQYCKKKRFPAEPAAARLAAKRAFLALFKIPTVKHTKYFSQIEIGKKKEGKPFLKISSQFKKEFKILKIHSFFLSIAHERTHAIAWVALKEVVSYKA